MQGRSTVGRILSRAGLNRLASLEPAKPVLRCLLHLDIKKLGRFRRPGHRVTGDRRQNPSGAGWEYVHVAIDDHSRIAVSIIRPDELGRSACMALLQTVRYYSGLGIRFQRVLTDNGSCYKSRKFKRLRRRLRLKYLRIKPYTPRTNEKPNASS